MARRLDKTLADYVTLALSPALIMLLVGSLMYFLLLVGYRGDYGDRLQWVMGWFVMAIVLIGRISIEDGFDKAVLYGLALTGAMALVVLQFVQQPLVAWFVLAIVWWSAHKLTWDCTLIDEQEDATGEGLLEAAGLDDESERAVAPANQPKEIVPADTSRWRQRFGRRRRKTSAPGVWVVYFSLAALPIFGFGQRFIPADDIDARRMAFWYLIIYVGSALGLLLTTSFLGLRRYLRQRKLQMPSAMTGVWMGCGAVLILLVLAVCAVVPRPSPEYAAGSFTGRLSSERQEASQYAVLRDSGTENPGGDGAPGEGKGQATGQTDGQGQGEQAESDASSQNGNSRSESTASNESSQQSNQGPNERGDPARGEQSSQSQPSSLMPDFTSSLFMLGRWILNLVLILAAIFIVIRYGRQLIAGFGQLWQSWRALLSLLFGRRPMRPDEGAVQPPAARPSFANFPNPFAQAIPGVRTPEQVVAYSFRALEAWASERNLGRHSQETPWEFAERLGAEHGLLARPVRDLATLYARLNYAQHPLTPSCLAALRAFWQSVESVETLSRAASTVAK